MRGASGALIPPRDEVERIADRLDRLTVHHRDPERFFEERSELVHELRTLARSIGGQRG